MPRGALSKAATLRWPADQSRCGSEHLIVPMSVRGGAGPPRYCVAEPVKCVKLASGGCRSTALASRSVNNLFRFEFLIREPLTTEQANLVLPAIRALLDQEGLGSNQGQLTPTDDGRWLMHGWTADLDYDCLLDRYPGRSIYSWQESLEAAINRIVTEMNPAARASCSWFYSDDENFYQE